MKEPDYDAIEQRMRDRPDSYFRENMSQWLVDQKAKDVPFLMDLANIYFNSFGVRDTLTTHFMIIFLETLSELHGDYIQSARSDLRPPLDKEAMIEQAYWRIKKEQYISSTMLHLAMSELED